MPGKQSVKPIDSSSEPSNVVWSDDDRGIDKKELKTTSTTGHLGSSERLEDNQHAGDSINEHRTNEKVTTQWGTSSSTFIPALIPTQSPQSRLKLTNQRYCQNKSFRTSQNNSFFTVETESLNSANDDDSSLPSSEFESDESSSVVEVPRRPRRRTSRSKQKGELSATIETERIPLDIYSCYTGTNLDDLSPNVKKKTKTRVVRRRYEQLLLSTSDRSSSLNEENLKLVTHNKNKNDDDENNNTITINNEKFNSLNKNIKNNNKNCYYYSTSDSESMLSELSEPDNDMTFIIPCRHGLELDGTKPDFGGQQNDSLSISRISMKISKKGAHKKEYSKGSDFADSKKINRWLEKLGKIGSGENGNEKMLSAPKTRKTRSSRSLLGDSDQFDDDESFHDDCSDLDHDSATDRTIGSLDNPESRCSPSKADLQGHGCVGDLKITDICEDSFLSCKLVDVDRSHQTDKVIAIGGMSSNEPDRASQSSERNKRLGRNFLFAPERLSPSRPEKTKAVIEPPTSHIEDPYHLIPAFEDIYLFADEKQPQSCDSPPIVSKVKLTSRCSKQLSESLFSDASSSRGRRISSVPSPKVIKSSSDHVRSSFSKWDESVYSKCLSTSVYHGQRNNLSSDDRAQRSSPPLHGGKIVANNSECHSYFSLLHRGSETISETRTRATMRRSRSGLECSSKIGYVLTNKKLTLRSQSGYGWNSDRNLSSDTDVGRGRRDSELHLECNLIDGSSCRGSRNEESSASDDLPSFSDTGGIQPKKIRSAVSQEKSGPSKGRSRYINSSLKDIIDKSEPYALLSSQAGKPINVGKYFVASTPTSTETNEPDNVEKQQTDISNTSQERESRSRLIMKIRSSSHSESRLKGRRKLITRTYSASGLLL